MEKYLVTGGAGFIGSHLVGELVSRGKEVRVFDNFSTGKKENLSPYLGRIELIEGDIRDFDLCKKAVEGVDFVLHQAALTSVSRSVEDPLFTVEVNIRGTLNLLLASRKMKVKGFVFASSSSVYGNDSLLPKREGKEGFPLSPYAMTKISGEMLCRLFFSLYSLPTISLRYFNIFGPRQDPSSPYAAVIPRFVTKMLAGERPVIFGDGTQTRDFTYVRNVVGANLLALQAKNAKGDAFNIACGFGTSVNTLVEKINSILGSDLKPIYRSPRPGDILHSFADISKAKKFLNYRPDVDFEEGLRMTIEWYKKGNKE